MVKRSAKKSVSKKSDKNLQINIENERVSEKFTLFGFKHNWVFYVVFLFLFVRLFLNLDFIIGFKWLSFGFAVAYLFLIVMLVKKVKFFTTVFVLFLTIDSMIGTSLFAQSVVGNVEFYGTMAINFVIMILVLTRFEMKKEIVPNDYDYSS